MHAWLFWGLEHAKIIAGRLGLAKKEIKQADKFLKIWSNRRA